MLLKLPRKIDIFLTSHTIRRNYGEIGLVVYQRFQPTPLKNDGVKVSWDVIPFPTNMESHKSHVPNHQPGQIGLVSTKDTQQFRP